MTPQDLDSFSAHSVTATEQVAWSPGHTALLVVDMVNDFCAEGGAMVLPDSGWLYPVITGLADGVRERGGLVVWIRDEHDEGDPEFRKRTRHCLTGSWGSQLVDALTPQAGDAVRPKHAFSAFYGTDLNEWLRRRGITTLIICGVVTNICVRSTTHDAFFHGYDVLIASDACAATSAREQESTLYDLETHFARVSTVAALLAGASR
jgi:ureidoacrylate peracid hydrolase